MIISSNYSMVDYCCIGLNKDNSKAAHWSPCAASLDMALVCTVPGSCLGVLDAINTLAERSIR